MMVFIRTLIQKKFVIITVMFCWPIFSALLQGRQTTEVIHLPRAWQDVFYEYQFEQPGLKSPAWELLTSQLPEGLLLEPSGKLHGIPRGPGGKDYIFTLIVKGKTDSSSGFSLLYKVKIEILPFPYWSSGENFRLVAGLEQTGASNMSDNQGVFLNLYFSYPFPLWFNKKARNEVVGRPLRIWGDLRLTSVAQQAEGSGFDLSGGFYNLMGEFIKQEPVKGGEFQVGLDYCLYNLAPAGKVSYSLSIIGSCGLIAPTNPEELLQLFKVPNNPEEYFPGKDFTGKDYIGFVNPSQDRFYIQWGVGLRCKTYFKPKVVNEKVITRRPAVFDCTIGGNESITGGSSGGVLRFEAFIPLQVLNKVTVYFFGTMLLKLAPAQTSTPLFLEPAPEDTPFPAENILFITRSETSRDFYRIGIGIDIRNIFY